MTSVPPIETPCLLSRPVGISSLRCASNRDRLRRTIAPEGDDPLLAIVPG